MIVSKQHKKIWLTREEEKIIMLRKKRQRNLSMDSSSKLTTEELTELERLISSDTVSCNEEEQEFWNTIVRKLRKNHDS